MKKLLTFILVLALSLIDFDVDWDGVNNRVLISTK